VAAGILINIYAKPKAVEGFYNFQKSLSNAG